MGALFMHPFNSTGRCVPHPHPLVAYKIIAVSVFYNATIEPTNLQLI